MKILFVEDEPVLRRTCLDAAKMCGHTARAALNGLEGLRMFKEQRPDAVVTDLIMSGMDGFDLIQLIRESDDMIPIFVVSALADHEARAKALAAGATRYFVKPVSAVDLVASLEEWVPRANSPSKTQPTPPAI